MPGGQPLYDAMKANLRRSLAELDPERQLDMLTFPPRAFHAATDTLLANLTSSGFCTLVVASPFSWDTRAPYYEQVRRAARNGIEIERAFLLSHRHARRNPSLVEHVALDTAAGIHTIVLNIRELLASGRLAKTDRFDVGLWDESLTCVPVVSRATSGQEFTEWRVSRRREDAEYVRNLRSVLLDAEVIDLGARETDLHLEEPIISSAPLAVRLAPVLCSGNYGDDEDCAWYHGIWQYLRVFDMVSTPTWHADFYISQLQKLALSGARRVLVTGAADYSMYAHVLHAFQRAGQEPEVTILDRCETPLTLCRWYGKLVGHVPTVVRADVLEYKAPAPFDVVVTDAFMTRFSHNDRPLIAKAWARYLRLGGALITTTRIEPDLRADAVVPSAAQVQAFRRRAKLAAERWRAFLLADPVEIERAAETYAAHMSSHAFRSVAEINAILRDDFEIRHSLVNVPGIVKKTLYAQLVGARK